MGGGDNNNNKENWRSEELGDIDGLALIDVSTEDDNLLFFSSSLPDPSTEKFSDTDKEDRGLCLFGDTHDCCDNDEIVVSSSTTTLEEKESHKMMKTHLRKSLAWDKAFFTNPGVLEPDELCSMMERKNLPTIREDLHRSTESISTFKSDCTVEETGLFEDVRASIQRSDISSDAATPDKTKEFGANEAAPPSPKTTSTVEDPGSEEKIKPNSIRKRPSIKAQGLVKVTKQPIATKEHNTSIPRPSTGLSRTTRGSVDTNKAKQETNPKLSGGKEPLASRVPISRRSRPTVSTPVVPFKCALRSSVASQKELTSSCSSLESCLSVSSIASNKSAINSVKQKKDQSLRIASHSLASRPTSRAGSRIIGQPKVSPLSASKTYKSKLNVSRLSASVDWSFESPRASTPNKMAKDASAVQNDPKLEKRGSLVNGGSVPSASVMKPTGLRVPSPKIGYFDGARSNIARTPTGSCTGLVSGLAKHGARTPNGSPASRTTSGKSQPTMSKAKASPLSRSSRMIVSASPKLTNKMYSKVSAEEQLG
ncbi:PREDICTED: TRIO and F-actin-binding protein-like isoform X2 [Camelina sativa]|uniref:TRIO and F-actin-binding protein-like isoform X2 n=1 Tax=Camelina sativa TaxID=90675 RepID=A0ABM0ZKB7_CAMSA|nr:PREDICTED: TRIO and F-actin-binding protein-like isoform X2 [Camelina sativa]